MQTLISQCLDANFLTEIFSEEGEELITMDITMGAVDELQVFDLCDKNYISDDYFVSNIERVDSVTLLRKDKLLTGRDVTWTLR